MRFMVEIGIDVDAPSRDAAAAFAMELVDVGITEWSDPPEDWEGGSFGPGFDVKSATLITVRKPA